MVQASRREVFSCFFSSTMLAVFEGIKVIQKNKIPVFDISSVKPGQDEIIYFKDGSTALCQLYEFTQDVSFSFHLDHFIGGYFMGLEVMRFHFSLLQLASGKILVECSCQFKMRSRLYMLLFNLFSKSTIQKKLDDNLALCAGTANLIADGLDLIFEKTVV